MSSTLSPEVVSRAGLVAGWIRAIRPEQWLKNGFVLSPIVFSGRALIWEYQWHALVAFAAFCAVASAVYLMNDVIDREADRLHPRKASRPVASGLISPTSAMVGSAVLGVDRPGDRRDGGHRGGDRPGRVPRVERAVRDLAQEHRHR